MAPKAHADRIKRATIHLALFSFLLLQNITARRSNLPGFLSSFAPSTYRRVRPLHVGKVKNNKDVTSKSDITEQIGHSLNGDVEDDSKAVTKIGNLDIGSSDPIPYAEASRKFRRTYYTHADWIKHRSTDRFFRNLGTLPLSGVVRQLAKEILFVTSVAAFVIMWNNLLIEGYTDFSGLHHDPLTVTVMGIDPTQLSFLPLRLPTGVFTLSSPALGLLLVFRSNSSYSRWRDGRKLWGAIVNHSRNVLRMGATWSNSEIEPDVKEREIAMKRLAEAVWAFPRSLQRHLLGEEEDERNFASAVRERMEPKRAEALIASRHRPTRALYDLSVAIDEIPMETIRRNEIDKSVIALCDACGGCERIFSSPVPLVYTRHTARFLSAWLILLPLGLWEPFNGSWNHIGLIPASAIISFFLFGIEELSVQLEEPFSILPLQTLVDGIGKSAEEFKEWQFEER